MSSSKDKSFFSLYITTSKDGLETAALVLVFDIRILDQHWLLGPECKSSSGSPHTLPAIFNKNKKQTTKRTTVTANLKGLEKPKVTFDAQTNVTAVSQTENP